MSHPWNRRTVQTVADCTKGSTATGKHPAVEERDSIEVVDHYVAHRAQEMQAYRTESHMASVAVHLEKEKSLAWATNSVVEHAALLPVMGCRGVTLPGFQERQMPQDSGSTSSQPGNTEDTART